jgi:hypothetical protein
MKHIARTTKALCIAAVVALGYVFFLVPGVQAQPVHFAFPEGGLPAPQAEPPIAPQHAQKAIVPAAEAMCPIQGDWTVTIGGNVRCPDGTRYSLGTGPHVFIFSGDGQSFEGVFMPSPEAEPFILRGTIDGETIPEGGSWQFPIHGSGGACQTLEFDVGGSLKGTINGCAMTLELTTDAWPCFTFTSTTCTRLADGSFRGTATALGTPIEINIENLEITQAVFDDNGVVDLVANRKTAILFDVDVSQDIAQPVAIEARLQDPQGIVTPLALEPNSVMLSQGTTKVTAVFTTDKVGLYSLVVAIDLGEQFPNSEKIERGKFVLFHRTNLGLSYKFFSPPDTPDAYAKIELPQVEHHKMVSDAFILSLYPLVRSGLSSTPVPSPLPAADNKRKELIKSPCGEREFSTGFQDDLLRLRNGRLGSHRSIGVVPSGYFTYHSFPAGVSGAHYKIKEAVIALAGSPLSTAHELGHSFGLPVPALTQSDVGEEYRVDPTVCAVPNNEADFGFFDDGYDVEHKMPISKALDFMGYGGWRGPFWIAPEHWQHLSIVLETTATMPLKATAEVPQLLLIEAIIAKDGTVRLGQWEVFEGTPATVEPGEYTVEIRNAADKPLFTIPFEVSFFLYVEPFGRSEVNSAPIALEVPYPLAAASVVILDPDGKVLVKVDPVYQTLADAVDTLPDECFTGDLRQQRQTLKNDIAALKAFLDASNPTGAIAKLDKDIRADALRALIDQCAVPYLSATPKETFLSLIDNAITHLQSRLVLQPPLPGDLDHDGDVDQDDLNILLADRNKPVGRSACGTACDFDGNGTITALDARKLTLLCTRPRCATK